MTLTLHPRIPPPAWPAGGLTDAELRTELLNWITCTPVRALADACGWRWPTATSPIELAGALADLTNDWDFRPNRGERGAITDGPLQMNGRAVAEALVADAARSLGLVAPDCEPEPGEVTLVLGAAVRGIVNRTHLALNLLRDRPAAHLTVLTAARPLTDAELEQANDLGLADCGLPSRPVTLEVDAVIATLRWMRPDLGEPIISEPLPPPVDPGDPDAARRQEPINRAAAAQLDWPGITVIVSPSSKPARRRTNTADQLRDWAVTAGPGPGITVTAVTTQIYVPYQQIAAIHAIGRPRRCGIQVIGVDPATAAVPTKRFASRDYLQEVRSTIRAAHALLKDLP